MKWEKIVEIAKGDVGKSRDEVGCPGTYAWCAAWVSSVLNRAGVGEGVTSTSCTLMQRAMSQNENWDEPLDWPVPGDIIFFDWDHLCEELPLDHVAVCVNFDEPTGQIMYINGNGSSEHYVTKQTININATSNDHKLVAYWMRYIGDHEEKPIEDLQNEAENLSHKEEPAEPEDKEVTLKVRQLRKGMTGGDVKTLQRLLFADGYSVGKSGDDGDFGDDTEKAVLSYQHDHGLSQDGIAGEKTLTELWDCKSMKRK